MHSHYNKINPQTCEDRDPSGCSVLKTSQSKELSPRDERLLLTG